MSIIDNRKAHFDYHIEERYEAGLVLEGWDAGLRPPPVEWTSHPSVVTSVHLYKPFALTHYRCPWVDPVQHEPTWPLRQPLEEAVDDGYVPLEGETHAVWDRSAVERLLTPPDVGR